MKLFLVIVYLLGLALSLVVGETADRKEDTYLNALHDVHGKNHEFVPGGIPDNFGATYPSAGYDYKPVYGPPSPTPVYGPPKPTYGPPLPHYPHHHHHVYPVYGPLPTQAPRGDWLWDKFHLKFDLFTLGKILLKLLIFKKIVKFIGVICLLMFLPTLIEKKQPQADETDAFDQGMFRNLKPIDDTARFNELTSFVLTSIESFADKQTRDGGSQCTSGELTCRFKRMLDTVDRNYPWKRVSKWVRNEVSVAQKVLPQSENPLESFDELSDSSGHDASMA